jgi:hypothetical protein
VHLCTVAAAKVIDMPWEDSFIYGYAMLKLVQAEMAVMEDRL